MSTNDPPFLRPAPNAEMYLPPENAARPRRLVERIPHDVWFTDELIRRCRAHASRGYRLAATIEAENKTDVLLVFEAFEWNGVPFPAPMPPKEAEGGVGR